ncbi:hypothetical protein BCR43DRAFT_493292 [Syncephalastrum racemosum]|uniref:Protein kinase domain-containing protein n=1 Tax=Syncephalastrum racemosum TaxID=13706 RepID=A0A1X2HAD7_SYNRA|nr:hypothetical protein BCR43DRAFT_493292 [Syncephalastrum racemosum]
MQAILAFLSASLLVSVAKAQQKSTNGDKSSSNDDISSSPLGSKRTQVRWRAGHAAAYVNPYVLLYGGSEDTTTDMDGVNLTGSTSLWVWDTRDGAWYQPTVRSDTALVPQVFFGAVPSPSSGQLLAVLSNSTQGLLQKLDINSWSWSFPSSSNLAPSAAARFATTIVNNTLYTYGGLNADTSGFPMAGAILNSLNALDANAYAWTSGSNGAGVTDHAMCYVPKCNCVISFGGTPTGSAANTFQSVYIYDLNQHTWNVQVSVQTINNAAPGARRLHTVNCLSDSMIVYGGGTTQPFDSDVWILDVSEYPTLTWRKPNVQNLADGPNARMGHTAVLDADRQKIYVFGGWGVSATNDTNMYALDIQNWSWMRVPPTGSAVSASAGPTGPTHGAVPDTPPDNPHNIPVGAVVGATVGGFVALLAALLLGCTFWRRRRRQQQQQSSKKSVISDNHNDPTSMQGEKKPDADDSQSGSAARVSHQRHTPWILPRSSSGGGGGNSSSTLLLNKDNNSRQLSVPSLSLGATTDSSPNVSHHALKLFPDNDAVGYQLPDNIITQKPNEYSRPTLPLHPLDALVSHYYEQPHRTSVLQSTSSLDAERRFSNTADSIEAVCQSPSKSTSSMMASAGIQSLRSVPWFSSLTTDSLRSPASQSEDEGISPVLVSSPGPIQYMPRSRTSHQHSIRTETTGTDMMSASMASSSIPVAARRSISSTGPRQSSVVTGDSSDMRADDTASTRENIHDVVSPLDRLAGLTHLHELPSPAPAPASDPRDADGGGGAIPKEWIVPSGYRLSSHHQRSVMKGRANTILFVTETATQRPVTIKLFQQREAWERECRTLTKLKSSHVVDLLRVLTVHTRPESATGSNDEEHKYMVVMERLTDTLAGYISRQRMTIQRPPPASTHAAVSLKILKCLLWCHTKGVAFCDLKPSNIMRTENDSWKLIDFEASRSIGQECIGVITPRYCPPEVAQSTTFGFEGEQGVVAAANVDLWALGCVIYELETGHPLFGSTIDDETVLHFVSHPSAQTPRLSNGLRWNEQLELDLPTSELELIQKPAARALIQQLLSREPHRRGHAADLVYHPYFQSCT